MPHDGRSRDESYLNGIGQTADISLVGQAKAYNQPLTQEEARDLYRLTDIITREYLGNAGSSLLFPIGGIPIGAAIAKD